MTTQLPAALASIKVTPEMVQAALNSQLELEDGHTEKFINYIDGYGVFKAAIVRRAIEAAVATLSPPANGAEPIAYMWIEGHTIENPGDPTEYVEETCFGEEPPKSEYVPLYAAPPADSAMVAALLLIDAFAKNSDINGIRDVVDELLAGRT